MTAPGAPGAPAPAGNDKTTLFGVLGIVLGLICCWPVGLVFAILSLTQSKKFGSSPTIAYIAFAACAVRLVIDIVGTTQGWYFPE